MDVISIFASSLDNVVLAYDNPIKKLKRKTGLDMKNNILTHSNISSAWFNMDVVFIIGMSFIGQRGTLVTFMCPSFEFFDRKWDQCLPSSLNTVAFWGQM